MDEFYTTKPGIYPQTEKDPAEVASGEGWILKQYNNYYSLDYLHGGHGGGGRTCPVSEEDAARFKAGVLSLDTFLAEQEAFGILFLRESIQKAFPLAPVVRPESLVSRGGGKFAETQSLFANKAWNEITPAMLQGGHETMFFLAPEALCYYLPAFMMAVLGNFSGAEELAHTLVGKLTRPEREDLPSFQEREAFLQKYEEMMDDAFTFKQAFGPLKSAQTEAVANFLRWLEQAGFFFKGEPTTALERYWDSASGNPSASGWMRRMERRSWPFRLWEASCRAKDILTNGEEKRREVFKQQEHIRALRQEAEALWQAGKQKEAAALYAQIPNPTATEKKRLHIGRR